MERDNTGTEREKEPTGSTELEKIASPYSEKEDAKTQLDPLAENVDDLKVKTRLVIDTNEDIINNVLDDYDDPEEAAWTFRSVFLGVGLSIFGSVLAEIYYFKPQTVSVSGIFLLLIAFVIGEAMALIPRKGVLKWINPHRFTSKEHGVAFIMASSAAKAAIGAEVLAVQRLWYNGSNAPVVVQIFTILTSQLLGYAFCGIFRKILIYPSKCIYPMDIQYATTIQTLHRDPSNNRTRLKVFYICLGALFCWSFLPEYAFKWLIGISIPCLAAPHSPFVSRLFGGSSGNEGLGFLSICLDWNYIGAPMTQPIVTTVNQLIGYFLCISVFMGVYYSNIWDSQRFPFLSQMLYYGNSTQEKYYLYDQLLILDEHSNLNETALQEQGVPYLTGTYVVYLIATNMALSATIVYFCLYHWDVMKIAFDWMRPSTLKQVIKTADYRFWKPGKDGRLDADGNVPDLYNDKHFVAMLKYKEIPNWWYTITLIVCFAVALVCCYTGHYQISWWELLIAIILAAFLTLMLSGLNAIFGFTNNFQTTVQMIGAYIRPGNPLANMYFTLYGYNSIAQAMLMLGDLKTAQYIKLPQRSTFVAQFLGSIIGGIFNFIMMNQIVANQREILLSPQGTAIWSGQTVQQYNTQGVTWGALAKHMYSINSRYRWVPLAFILGFVAPLPFYALYRLFPKNKIIKNLMVPIFVSNIGWLVVGINSGTLSYMVVAFGTQFYLRKYKAEFFVKYNYLISAGLMGGTQIFLFLASFAFYNAAGSGGGDNPMPPWWGSYTEDAQGNTVNPDHCMYLGG